MIFFNRISSGLFLVISMALGASSQAQVAPPTAANADTTATIVKALVDEFGQRMVNARYMEKNCRPVTWPGYENYPTQLCQYTVTDRATGTTKTASVVMLNPDPDKVARWIATACATASGTLTLTDGRALFKHVISASGGQFAVAGVVYEDMEGDGWMKAYCFRDGVTVRIDGIEHRTTNTLTPAEQEITLHGPVTRVYTYARIASTSPDDYRAGGGKVDVGTNQDRKFAWMTVVRDAYLKAWNSDSNELINAWALNHR